MANKATGRHRADVEINVLESFELRSRRSIRESERARLSRLARKQAKKLAKLQAAEKAANPERAQAVSSGRYLVRAQRKIKFYQRRGFRNSVNMAVASGLFATFALPAYAYSPEDAAMSRFSTTDAQAIASAADTQNLTVAAVNTVKYARGNYESANANEIARQETLNAYRTYTGPTAADYILNPPYSKLDGATILKVAAKYVGTPYVFGGETPRGFDCSGYVAFVFAQFGIALPHSVHGQNRMGILIRPEDALPGDLVVMDDLGHDGIYAGNGNFYHAPRPGDYVKLAPIYTSRIHFVRLGTN
ncbi:MAG: C40 family peptidase [Rhodoluna sp.]|nr:C40 family peptidase [Rhodoluna sp.]MBP7818654.1 C40 family peptidase [Rhodoluna sp.]